ncbi:hypothetical protein [Streptomyces peucetius]|nr:hypothetical protein CGZ69_00320 [Streptomyces peucetius subsp. caesius ATCC 27952]
MPLHAIEITLTRPATPAELHRANRIMALAPDADRTRLMTLASAKASHKALQRTRERLEGLLPLDILTTHYPDPAGGIILNIALPAETHAQLEEAAHRTGQSLETHLAQVVLQSVALAEQDQARRLDAALEQVLTWSTPYQLLVAAARIASHPTTAHGVSRC